MNNFDSQRQDSLKRRWQERQLSFVDNRPISSVFYTRPNPNNQNNIHHLQTLKLDDDLVSNVVPPVTVVLEGRSICQRINLQKHASYQTLARALRQMFVDPETEVTSDTDLDLSNAVPGHLVAYEDIENDLLLAGDLNWKDFVRVARRIRILPSKANARSGGT